MCLGELFEGSDGKLDEQAVLSVLFGLTLIGLTIYLVVVRKVLIQPLDIGVAFATFLGGSLGGLTVRNRFGNDNARPPVQ